MKILSKFTLLLSMSFIVYSCNKDNALNQVNAEDTEYGFAESVVFLKNNNPTSICKSDTYINDNESVITIEIINFNPNFKLEIEYNIDGVKFTDSGEYNDEVAGDGIYTSVETFPIQTKNASDSESKQAMSIGRDFKYSKELDLRLSEKFGHNLREIIENNQTGSFVNTKKATVSVSVGCKIVTRQCPETSWYNSCLFSSPCTCVYLEDCELTVEVGI